MSSTMGRVKCAFTVGLIGLFLFLMGLGFLWFGTKSLIRMWAWENLTLKNGSEAMKRWKQPSQPISMKVYIFNLTNPEAVSNGAPPVFSEVGPYVYEQHPKKVNITQLENFTLSYQLQNVIQFKPNLSGRLKESDMVTTVNVPLVGAIVATYEAVPEFVGYWDELWKFFYPGQRNVFITTSVRDILFDGILIDCTSKITEIYIACRGLDSRKGIPIRKEGKNFKFSFFYSKNGTSKETYQVNQGVTDMKKSAQFVSVDFLTSTNTWKNSECDMINGSDGAQFPVMLNKDEKLYIYEKELCRSVYIEFEAVVNRKGVELYKYSASNSLFASADNNPDNLCFCREQMTISDVVKDEEDEEMEVVGRKPNICFQDGILPLMPCVEPATTTPVATITTPPRLNVFIVLPDRAASKNDVGQPKFLKPSLYLNNSGGYYVAVSAKEKAKMKEFCTSALGGMIVTGNNFMKFFKGSPIVVSFPHFYLGDQIYSNFTDFKPVKDLHETAAYVEPFSGVTVVGFKRLQFNLEVKKIPDVQITSNLVDCVFPILWVEEGMELSTELFKLLRLSLIQKRILEYGTVVLIGVGLFLIIAAYTVQFLVDRSKGHEHDDLKKSDV